jgi:hypothetical protein
MTVFLYLGQKWYYPVVFTLQLMLLTGVTVLLSESITVFTIEKRIVKWILVWMFPLIGYILYALTHINDNGREVRVFIAFSNKLILLYIGIMIINFNYIKFMDKYCRISNIMILLSIILFFLLLTGLYPYEPSLIDFETNNDIPHYNFLLGTTNVLIKIGKTQVIRMAGWMEEPGALALLITYLLIINELIFHSKVQRFFYIISGLLTFSMAYIISLFLMFPLFFKDIFRITNCLYVYIKKKYFFISIIPIIILAVVIYKTSILSSQHKSYNQYSSAFGFLSEYTLSRFTYDPDKKSLSGDNRYYKKVTINNIWFGDGEEFGDATSIPTIIQRRGIIPFLFCYFPVFFLALEIILKVGFKRGKWFSLIILANIMQRVTVDNLYIMILWTVIYFSLDNKCSYRKDIL